MIAIIINPISGGATPAGARRRIGLASAAIDDLREQASVLVSERRGHARELAAAAVAQGARLVIAWGGDGTVNEVSSALVSTGAALGIVPTGSGNGLARELRVVRDARTAIQRAVHNPPRKIDAGELGGRLFFSIAGVGFDAHVAACFDRATGRRGFSTYVRVSARELLGYQCGTYRFDEPERADPPADPAGAAPARRRALIVTFANSAQFGNGARIAPGARLDDGLLDMVVFEESSRLATLWALPRLFTGGVSRLRGVSIRQVQQATIDSDAPMTFHVDGEPVQGGTRLEARIHPGVLHVCV
jgi:diacylglycerol kinase family enzyme